MSTRTSCSQFEIMVDYMERNGDLNKPAGGPHGRLSAITKWEEITMALNLDTTGQSKPVEKWKKMVYKYKRKTNQAQWSEDSMMLAIADCNSGIPVKTTAKKYGLPYATLYRHWKKGSLTAQLGRFRKVFNDEQEGDLRTYLYDMDSIFYGLTREDFKTLVFEYAKRNIVTYPPSWDKNEKAGDDWLAGFMRRNPQITLRIPEATSIGRVKGFNRPQVERFYKLLSEQIEKYQIDDTRIYNVDETGIQTSTNKPPKVLSVKGKKQVGVISSTERGQTTTIVCCCNASGSFVPPFMIFARKRMQDRLLDGSPPETRGSCSASGWINGEIFLDPIVIYEDNNGCISIANNPTNHKRTKHIDIKYHFSREQIEKNVIKLNYIPTGQQLADALTKPLPAVTFHEMTRNMGLQ
ncbi:uncharacterized protein LOC111362485 isoform X2 [Spodoptera litura]|uniref:Uncharacterized protein LOC111362485 isoform X2 n=1 Tax=Spodoptera litura TaxID=69820 RepID=A0A9J7EU09_SPOLT|nr:uncharacterized protein LOC111362485 isoform X2 [Spodoptera litura]